MASCLSAARLSGYGTTWSSALPASRSSSEALADASYGRLSTITPHIFYSLTIRVKIFIYAGENDIAAGKNSAFVLDEFQKLWQMIRQQLPKAQIYFMSIKPSPSRARYFNEMINANKLIKAYLVGKPKSHFVDVSSVIYKDNTSTPDSSLFKADYLHLNSGGYDRWQRVLKPYVK